MHCNEYSTRLEIRCIQEITFHTHDQFKIVSHVKLGKHNFSLFNTHDGKKFSVVISVTTAKAECRRKSED